MKIKLASELRNLYALALSTRVNRSHPQVFRFSGKIPFETQSKKLPHVAISKKSKILFQKKLLIFQKNPNFDGFENSDPIAFYGKSATI